MYCKNCGKKLSDDARFCDRCNMSVRKKEDKMELIEELMEERLARRKTKAVEERLKKIKQIRYKKYKTAALITAVILGLGIISGALVFVLYPDNSKEITDVAQTTETPQATNAPVFVIGSEETSAPATAAVVPTQTTSVEKETVNADGYIEAEIGEKDFAYPRSFSKQKADSALLVLSDEHGGGKILANRETSALPPKDLMKKFADKTGGNVIKSLADNDGYEITISVGSDICHRKSVVNNGIETYYEIRYPAQSRSKDQYSKDIEYMDSFISKVNE